MQIRARQLIFIKSAFVLILTCTVQLAQAEPSLRLTSNVIWSQSDSWFGGFSGAEVMEQGSSITLITDKGRLVLAKMVRETGKLKAIQLLSQTQLTDADGTDLIDHHADAEGLAIDGQGHAFVSFERDHRIVPLNLKSARVGRGVSNPAFTDLIANSGFEALANHPDGRLYTLPERSGTTKAPFPVFTLAHGRWVITQHIPQRDPFRPVGADFGDDGLFYLLERAASPLGFRSRIRRFDFTSPDLSEQILLTTYPGRFDNLEALSIWRDRMGQTHLTLISDDNFLAIQRTQIVEFALTE